MQKLGQHFLKNKKIAAEIIDALAMRANDVVFEIGPGHGELTEKMKMESEKPELRENKIKIIAIEKDEKLYETLKKRYENDALIAIIHGDALAILPSLIAKNRGPESDYLLVGNIPYYITGHLLRIVSELENKPERCVFMVQKEVAERIAAREKIKRGTADENEKGAGMNRLAASVQFWAEPKIIAVVPKKDFRPAPDVDSAVILLARKNSPLPCDADRYYAAVRAIFSQPRKTVLNNISEAIARAPLNIRSARRAEPQKKSFFSDEGMATKKKETVAAALEAIGIDPLSRPQNLSIEDIATIAKKIF